MQRECTGDASESALLKCVELSVGDVAVWRCANQEVCELPFNSINKFSVSIRENDDPSGLPYILLMKGAPERILARCSTILLQGREIPLTETQRKLFNEACSHFGSLGERILGTNFKNGCTKLSNNSINFDQNRNFRNENEKISVPRLNF